MSVLKKLTNANGGLLDLIPGAAARVKEYLNNKPAFNAFKNDVMNKFFDEFQNVAQLTQTIANPNEWMFFTGNETPGDDPIANELRVDVTNIFPAKRVKLNSFISKYDLFFCSETGDLGGHSFVIRKLTPGIFELINPQGTPFSQPELQALSAIFSPNEPFRESVCQFQINSETCALWSLLIIAYAKYTPQQILAMINHVKTLFNSAQRGNEIVLLTLFDKFLQQGFATPAEVASYVGQFQGLGRKKGHKCRKCGLPKS